MGVSIGQAKQQFATIIECLHREPPLLSQFAVWLDMKVAEYKLQGGMRLDFHEVVSHPDWMQGVKCRCLQTVASKMNLQQSGGFGSTAWMFPLMETAGNSAKQSDYSADMVNHGSAARTRDNDAIRQNGLDRESVQSSAEVTDDLTVPSGVGDKNSLVDDRNIMNSSSVGYPEKRSDKGEQPGAASTFLSNLAMAASYDPQKEGGEPSGMSLPVRPIGEETALESPVDEQYIGDYLADSGDEDVHSNDMLGDDDDIADFDDDEEDHLPKIVSVTTVNQGSSFAYPKGVRANKKGKTKLRIIPMCKSPAKKMRVVRNYSREFKLRVIGHCLKHGTKSAMLTFDVPKTNCQRWTARVAKSSPDCGIPDTSGLESELARAEERLATWVRDTYQDSGSPTILALQSMASTIFKHVHPDFEPAYVWVLNYLARYKLAKMVDLPCDFDDACPVTTEDLSDLC